MTPTKVSTHAIVACVSLSRTVWALPTLIHCQTVESNARLNVFEDLIVGSNVGSDRSERLKEGGIESTRRNLRDHFDVLVPKMRVYVPRDQSAQACHAMHQTGALADGESE